MKLQHALYNSRKTFAEILKIGTDMHIGRYLVSASWITKDGKFMGHSFENDFLKKTFKTQNNES